MAGVAATAATVAAVAAAAAAAVAAAVAVAGVVMIGTVCCHCCYRCFPSSTRETGHFCQVFNSIPAFIQCEHCAMQNHVKNLNNAHAWKKYFVFKLSRSHTCH